MKRLAEVFFFFYFAIILFYITGFLWWVVITTNDHFRNWVHIDLSIMIIKIPIEIIINLLPPVLGVLFGFVAACILFFGCGWAFAEDKEEDRLYFYIERKVVGVEVKTNFPYILMVLLQILSVLIGIELLCDKSFLLSALFIVLFPAFPLFSFLFYLVIEKERQARELKEKDRKDDLKRLAREYDDIRESEYEALK